MRYTEVWWFYLTVVIYLLNLTSGDQPKIIIVGAGVSGIAAATKLYENGFNDITILEAENRIGGRVYTRSLGGMLVDMGAQWVHGEINNTVYELASPLGLLEIPEEVDGEIFEIYDSEGHMIPKLITENFVNLFISIEDTSTAGTQGRNDSIGDFFIDMINATISTEVEKFSGVDDVLLKQFVKLYEDMEVSEDSADSWYDISAKGRAEIPQNIGHIDVTWKDKGYETIIDILLKKYPNPEEELPVRNNTVLNIEVTNVNYNSTNQGKVSVETSAGQSYIADHVIVTPSLGVLKEQYKTLFTPELPESKVKAIEGLAFGNVAKLYLYYETPWWSDNSTYAFLWNESDRNEYEQDPDKKWLLNLFLMTKLPHKPRILCGWLSGPGSRYMESLPEDQVLNQTLAFLNKFLGNSYNVTRPTEFFRTTWHSNKHFRGTYSFRSMDSERAGVSAYQLGTPLLDGNDKPIVMFAGEATDIEHYANVHGAIDAGYREANRLINLYKSKL